MPLANFLSRFVGRTTEEKGTNSAQSGTPQKTNPVVQLPTPELSERLLRAVALHKQGELAKAEAIYGEILQVQPRHFDALHYLGLIALQQGRAEAGVRLILQAIDIDGTHAPALSNLAQGLLHLGRLADAIVYYNQALQFKPDAVELYSNLSNALLGLRQADEALAVCNRGLQVKSDAIALLQNRGTALLMLRRNHEAVADFDRVLAQEPDFVDALNNRGVALAALDRKTEALESYDRALALNPDFVDALNNRGRLLAALARNAEALESYDRALALNPDFVDALNNRGVVLASLHRYTEAIACYDKAILLAPNFAAAYTNRGNAYRDLHQAEQALFSYEHSLRISPDCPESLSNRAAVLSELGRHAEAAQCYARLMSVAPEQNFLLGNLFYSLLHCCDWSQYERFKRDIPQLVIAGKKPAVPGVFINASESLAEQRQCAGIYVEDQFPASASPLWKGVRYRHDKIRVAYLSADFHNHATAFLMAGLFESHDRQRFETVAISYGPNMDDEMRGRLQQAFDRFIDVREQSDLEVAELIRQMEIDIAIDLKGFTGGGRMGILAHRPAPVQVNYLGYPGTLGAGYIDYLLADHHIIPESDRQYYSENVVYLPDSYQVTDAQRRIAEYVPSREEAGLPASGFVFCSFNNNYKITPEVFAIWMRLLQQVPGSVLWLYEGNAEAVTNLRREAQVRGVAAERLVFAPKLPQSEHLARMKLADLFLDTLPVNAHTTASDALWAGLPVLTCMGKAFVGRVAGSLLHAIGLSELVTENLAQYEALALKLARSPGQLAQIKAQLAANRSTFPLFDTKRFTRHIEAAYVEMWERCQRGDAPAGFSVQPYRR